jgi:hypothetical protein
MLLRLQVIQFKVQKYFNCCSFIFVGQLIILRVQVIVKPSHLFIARYKKTKSIEDA